MENAAMEAKETVEREIEEHRRHAAYAKSVFRRPQTDQDTVNSTRSLYDSDVVYIKKHGRTYVGDYYMPIDEEELDRLRIIHQIYLQMFDNNLSTVPLHSPTRILDIGTGSGDWAMGMGDQWPDAEIIGTDIAKVQPTAVPLNVFFEIDDAEEEGGWTWPANEFDLVHLRNMAGAFSNWDNIYAEAFVHLKPGGWIEVMDFDDHRAFLEFFAPESSVPRMVQFMGEAARKSGRPRGVQHLEPEMLIKRGFVDVQVREFGIPMGPWPEERGLKTVGKLWLVAMLSSLEAYTLRLLVRELGWEEGEVRKLCGDFEAELKRVALDGERARGMQSRMRVLTGRKPGGEGEDEEDADADADGDGDSMTTGMGTPTVNPGD
ncbi:methyltransferase domain-containing protein [Rutstroemia sp. NJR-2017a BBW]|nr:methyltransferase domain-containing protein [Rutstroemia sp. NJR-2017a BBW]